MRAEASDAPQGAVIDLNRFRLMRSLERSLVDTAHLVVDRQPTGIFAKTLAAGDKVLDPSTREVGTVVCPTNAIGRAIVQFSWGRRAVYPRQVELWDGEAAQLPCDCEAQS